MAQSKYYICTLGTSVANALKEVLWAKQKTPGEWDDRDEAFEKALGNQVQLKLNDKAHPHEFSAEFSVLKKAGISSCDKVVLLSTDNGLSRICGETTKRLIISEFGLDDSNVELVRIPGLQVADAERLRRVGLPEFVKAVVSRIEENRYTCETFLCPVGGYKGIVPFLTALGMAFHLPVLYTFEFIDSLIRLPTLPFSLDRELYARAKDALVELGRKCEMHETEFLARIKGYENDERDLFLSFVESSGRPGFVTSTAFTETFAPDFECEKAPVAPQVVEDLDALSHGQWYRTACNMVIQSQDRVIRRSWMGNHKKTTATDLVILKQGNASIRVLGYEAAGRFYVCRVLAHDDYQRLLDSKNCPKIDDFKTTEFIEWSLPPEVLPDQLKDEESPYEVAMRTLADYNDRLQSLQTHWAIRVNELKQERDSAIGDLKQKLAAAEKGQRTMQSNLSKAKSNLDRAEQGLKSLKEANDVLAAQIEDATAENQALKVAIDKQTEEYTNALNNINDLRRKLRAAQTRLAMAPGDTDAIKAAQHDIEEKKAQIERAFQTLMMSDKSDPQPSEELRSLREERRKLGALLNAKADEVRQLEDENSSLSDALRSANERLQKIKKLGFWGRLAWSIQGKI